MPEISPIADTDSDDLPTSGISDPASPNAGAGSVGAGSVGVENAGAGSVGVENVGAGSVGVENVGAGSVGDSEGALHGAVAEVVKVIRPAIQADQGDIFLRGVDEGTGVVSVELVGACVTCPASTQTLKQGLERILKQRVEGVTEVRHVGEELLGAEEGTAVSL